MKFDADVQLKPFIPMTNVVPAKPCARVNGFTLVEVMVVLVILGLTATFTTLGFQRLEDDQLKKQAGYLSTWLQNLSDNAVLDGAVYGVWMAADGDRLESGYFYNNRWWKVTGDEAYSEVISDNVELFKASSSGWQQIRPVAKDTDNDADDRRPDILFMPTGLSIPEKFELRESRERTAVIERDDNGLYTWSTL